MIRVKIENAFRWQSAVGACRHPLYHLPIAAACMPPKDKAKAAGISASSFFDLKAELSKQEENFAKNKAAGKGTGGAKRADKVRDSALVKAPKFELIKGVQ